EPEWKVEAPGGPGRAQRAVRVLPFLRVADRREPPGRSGVQQQVCGARRALFLGSAAGQGRRSLSISRARVDPLPRLGARRQECRVQRAVRVRRVRAVSSGGCEPGGWGGGGGGG